MSSARNLPPQIQEEILAQAEEIRRAEEVEKMYMQDVDELLDYLPIDDQKDFIRMFIDKVLKDDMSISVYKDLIIERIFENPEE